MVYILIISAVISLMLAEAFRLKVKRVSGSGRLVDVFRARTRMTLFYILAGLFAAIAIILNHI